MLMGGCPDAMAENHVLFIVSQALANAVPIGKEEVWDNLYIL
jgi:hypothetical protein